VTWTLLVILWHAPATAVPGFASSAACDYAASTVQRYVSARDIVLMACVPSDRVAFKPI
jgi:hypothetical protein